MQTGMIWHHPSPCPIPAKAKKKNKEDTADKTLEDAINSEDNLIEEDLIQVVSLASQFDNAAAVAGTFQLWMQLILYPTKPWKNIRIKGELTGFSPDKLFGEGKTVHNVSRLGIIQSLDSRSSITTAGWCALFDEVFSKDTGLQKNTHIERQFAIWLALSNPRVTSDKSAWIGTEIHAWEDIKAWTGAYLSFSAPWNMEKAAKQLSPLKEQPDSKENMTESLNVDLTNVIETEEAATTKEPVQSKAAT
jgi:hypothetical protein